MSFSRRIIAFLLSVAVLAGTTGVPLVAAYCCDKLESVTAYTHLCDDCGADDAQESHADDGDCCSTTVVVKKVEDSGYLPNEKQFVAAEFFAALPATVPPDLVSSVTSPVLLAGSPVRGAHVNGRLLLAFVCILRL